MVLLGASAQAQPAPHEGFRVTLLGTGTPGPDISRFGPATLVQAGDQTLLFDAGRGTAIRMRRQGESARSTYWCPTCQPE